MWSRDEPDDRPVRESQTVEPGDVVSIVLVPTPAPRARRRLRRRPPRAARPSARRTGWSPVIVYFGGALTLALAGITVWSGIDTLQQKDVVRPHPSQNNLDVGRQKEARTNVLLGARSVGRRAHRATAIVLVDWRGDGARRSQARRAVQLGAGLGSLAAPGAF